MSYDNVLTEMIHPESPFLIAKWCLVPDSLRQGKLALTRAVKECPQIRYDSVIQDCDVLAVDSSLFHVFAGQILPHLSAQIILITGRWQLPQISLSNDVLRVLNSTKVIHWFAQNPVLMNHSKYSPFPYGVRDFVKVAKFMLHSTLSKSILLNHLNLKNTHGARKSLPFVPRVDFQSYLKGIRASKFVISPVGDRPDTYRHYESIALGAMPISNVPVEYRDLYRDDMIYCSVDEMLSLLKGPDRLETLFHRPSCEILSVRYWKHQIWKIIRKEHQDNRI
eukprot:764418-Hanusia_phi.AAC.3